ncbi:hypothetical protein NLU13_5322 [Sarocladium strictum]|uniref:Uncharacterized protein n=1 Tax=Sarocladium strictum TaxID=5046 RepID=A0AA39GGN5_SARSR|nr:hypothetical protein NLU13_5322 [Sarocladium strictum]
MADGIAPAVEKVGLPAPGAPATETQPPAASGLSGEAPTFKPSSVSTGPAIPGLTATAPPSDPPSAAAAPPSVDPIPEKSALATVDEKKFEHGAGGAGPALSAPKPVEVMSVPDTPINGSTPAAGTPRPELDIPTEKVQKPKDGEAPTSDDPKPAGSGVTSGVQEPAPTPVVSLPKDDSIPEHIKDSPSGPGLNGKPAGKPAEMTGAIQTHEQTTPAAPPTLKRKLEDDEPSEKLNGGAVQKPEPERTAKKAKLDEGAAAAPAEKNSSASKPAEDSTVTTAESPSKDEKASAKTNGRAKRGMGKRAKKIAEAVIGKTARKTRSQGPA